MIEEVSALKFELNPHALPFVPPDLPFGLTIREPRLNRLDHVTQFSSDHPEQKHDALLINGLVSQSSKIERISIDRAVVQFVVA